MKRQRKKARLKFGKKKSKSEQYIGLLVHELMRGFLNKEWLKEKKKKNKGKKYAPPPKVMRAYKKVINLVQRWSIWLGKVRHIQ